MADSAADRNLLFGLLALQIGLIDQAQLVAAFQAWTLEKDRPLAEHLADRDALDADQRGVVEAMVGAAPQEARRQRREEPGRPPRRPLDAAQPRRARRSRDRRQPRRTAGR